MVVQSSPASEPTGKQRQAIIDGRQEVLDARALHPERSLADHYNPLAMSPELLAAHRALDKAVDAAFGAPRLLKDDKERLEVLFARYAEMTSQTHTCSHKARDTRHVEAVPNARRSGTRGTWRRA